MGGLFERQRIDCYFGTYFGTPLNINISILLTGLLFWAMGYGVLYLILLASVIIHEYGHVIGANVVDRKAVQVNLSLRGCKTYVKYDSFDPLLDFIIAGGGPFFSMFAAAICLALPQTNYVMLFCIINFLMAVINLIPIIPSDGGKMVMCLLSTKMKYLDAAKSLLLYNRAFFIIMLVCFYNSIIMILAISFLAFLTEKSYFQIQKMQTQLKQPV